MNKTINEHYKGKVANYEGMEHRVRLLRCRLEELDSPKCDINVDGNQLSLLFALDRAKELKSQVAVYVRAEIDLIEKEMEAL